MDIAEHIRTIPDLPETGNPVLRHLDPAGACAGLAPHGGPARGRHTPARARYAWRASKAGGSWSAAPLALQLGCGFAMAAQARASCPARRSSLHLRPGIRLRHGRAAGGRHQAPGQKVVILDDLLATGGHRGWRAAPVAAPGGGRRPRRRLHHRARRVSAGATIWTCRSRPCSNSTPRLVIGPHPELVDGEGRRLVLRQARHEDLKNRPSRRTCHPTRRR